MKRHARPEPGQPRAAAILIFCAALAALAGEARGLGGGSEPPPIAPLRWLTAPPPVPEPRSYTRADYLAFVERIYGRGRPAALAVMGRPDVDDGHVHARREAFLYSVTGDPAYARNALAFLRGDLLFRTEGAGTDPPPGAVTGSDLLVAEQTYAWLRSGPILDSTDHVLIRRWLLRIARGIGVLERGAMNRATASAAALRVLARWYPSHAIHAEYAESTWNDWWTQRDSIENSTGYNGLWLSYLARSLDLLDQPELAQDPGMRQLAERFLAQLAPPGAMPGYGDVLGFHTDPGRWIYLMERWASAYRDGRFKHAAQRLFQWLLEHEADYAQWGNPLVAAADDLMDAYQVAEDSIPARAPDAGAVVTRRKAIRWRDPAESTELPRAELLDREIFDKLIFRTGWGPADAYALIELSPPMLHGHGDTASLNAYVSEGSVMLADTPYVVRGHPFHNTVDVAPDPRPEGWRWGKDIQTSGRMTTQIRVFDATDSAGYAHVRVEGYLGTDAHLDRRIFFLGRLGLLLRDTLRFETSFSGRVGPSFQFTGIHPRTGPNWIVGAQVSLPVANIWKLDYLMQLGNRPRDLLVWFVPRSDAGIAIDDVSRDDSGWIAPGATFMNNFTRRVRHSRSGSLAADTPITFTSLLLPHRPTSDPAGLARSVHLVLGEKNQQVLRIDLGDDVSLWVGLNETGTKLAVGPLATDARRFVVRTRAGRPAGHWLSEGRSLHVAGEPLHATQSRASVDRLGEPLPAL